MIPVTDIYDDANDLINAEENGSFGYSLFNRFSWKGQLRLMEWLSGDISVREPPEPYLSQKNRDWLAPFVKKFPTNVVNGIITWPSDYYLYQDLYLLRGITEDCEEGEQMIVENKPVTVLSNDKFYKRANTFIDGLKPSQDKVIGKQVGKTFEFDPSDAGSVCLEYIRYPVKAKIVTKFDSVYNEDVPDLPNCINFEFDEYARELLVWFIADSFANRYRESALKQTNTVTGKTIRDGK
jgi:hypothetical protein